MREGENQKSEPTSTLNARLIPTQGGVNNSTLNLESIAEHQNSVDNENGGRSVQFNKQASKSSLIQHQNSNQHAQFLSSKKEAALQHHSKGVIRCRNPSYILFELLLFVLSYAVFFVYPIEIFYQLNVLQYSWLDSAVKGLIFTLFSIQIVLKFNISYFHRGTEHFDRKMIRAHYMGSGIDGRFFWDCVSLLGLLIDTFSLEFPLKWLTYILFYTKILFVIEFDTYIRSYLQLRRKTLAAYELTRLFFIVMFVSNILACIFYRIGTDTYDTYGTNWMQSIDYTPALDSDGYLYLYSLYWSIATMATVAYGDVVPKNPAEVFYACFAMFIATMSFGYIINQVLDIAGGLNQGISKVEKQMTAISRYMRDKNVKEELQYKVKDYLEYQLMQEKERSKETENELIGMLPSNIKAELFYEMNTFFFKNFAWTAKFSDQFISAISFSIEETIMIEDSILYEPSFVEKEDEVNLFYIARGEVEIRQDLPEFSQGKGVKLHTVKAGNFIGTYQFFTGRLVKEILKCKTPVKAFIIQRSIFLETIKHFPLDQELWDEYTRKIVVKKEYEEFGLFCYNCLTHDHVIEHCPLLTRQTMLTKREELLKKWRIDEEKQAVVAAANAAAGIGIEQKTESNSNEKADQATGAAAKNELTIDVNKHPEIKIEGEQEAKNNNPNKQLPQQPFLKLQPSQLSKQSSQKPFADSGYLSELSGANQVEDISDILDDDGRRLSRMNKSFILLQERNIEHHIKHTVYQETEEEKWKQRAKVHEQINRKRILQEKRFAEIGGSSDEVLYSILQSIKTILANNNMDFNQLCLLAAENHEKDGSEYRQKMRSEFNKSCLK